MWTGLIVKPKGPGKAICIQTLNRKPEVLFCFGYSWAPEKFKWFCTTSISLRHDSKMNTSSAYAETSSRAPPCKAECTLRRSASEEETPTPKHKVGETMRNCDEPSETVQKEHDKFSFTCSTALGEQCRRLIHMQNRLWKCCWTL